MQIPNQLTLRVILTRPDHPEVKIMRGSTIVRRVPAREALLMAHASDYHYRGTAMRIKTMEEANCRLWSACWRNSEAAVLPPSADWFVAVGSR